MRKYDSYKDSGIKWIGEIPEHWLVKKIKHRCYVKAIVGWKGLKSDEFLAEGFAYLVTGSDFRNNEVNWKECYHIDEERYNDDPFIQLKNEDLLITKDGTIGKLAIVRKLDKPACLNSGIFVVRSTNKDFSTEFLFWILKSKAFTQFNEYTSYGSTIQHLYQNVFVEFSYPFPTPSEQTAIAAYLDRKTAEIDELIADKKRLLELYEEEKTAIINELVTGKKVWDGHAWTEPAEVKDSGIEWLGEIPEHWEVKRLKYVANLRSGNNIVSEQIKESDEYPVFGGNGLRGFFSEYTHDGNYVLIGRQGAYCGNIKFGHGRFWASEHAVVVSPLVKYETIYLGELLRTMNLGQYSVSAAQPGLSVDVIKNLAIPFPPLEEQQYIVRYIENECALIDAKKAKTEKLIELLTEYRTALISEVVTGKIKVID